MHCYPQDISDKTNLYTAIQTNAAYMSLHDGGHPLWLGCHPGYCRNFRTWDAEYWQGAYMVSGENGQRIFNELIKDTRQGCHLMQSVSKIRIHHSGIHLAKALLCSELTFIENQIDRTPYWSLIVLVQFWGETLIIDIMIITWINDICMSNDKHCCECSDKFHVAESVPVWLLHCRVIKRRKQAREHRLCLLLRPIWHDRVQLCERESI